MVTNYVILLQVTLATILTGHISMLKGILYMICQVVGSILGSLLLVGPILLAFAFKKCSACRIDKCCIGFMTQYWLSRCACLVHPESSTAERSAIAQDNDGLCMLSVTGFPCAGSSAASNCCCGRLASAFRVLWQDRHHFWAALWMGAYHDLLARHDCICCRK